MGTQKERDEKRRAGLLLFHRNLKGNGRRVAAAARHKRALAEHHRSRAWRPGDGPVL